LDVLLDGCIGVRDLRCESYNTGGERIEGEIRYVWVRGATLGAGRNEMRVPKRAGMKRAGRAQWRRVFQKAFCWNATRGGYGRAIE
jgi:hypothetical protein